MPLSLRISTVNGSCSKRAESDELLLTWQGAGMTGIGDVVLVLRVPLALPRKSPAEVPVL